MIHFNNELTLGTLLSALTCVGALIVAYNKATSWLDVKLAEFTVTLNNHATQLSTHAQRMDRYEARYVDMASDLQYLAGRSDLDRRRNPRPSRNGGGE